MSSRSFPLASILQYAVLGMIAYVLAGAPLLSLVTNFTYDSKKARASFGQPSALSHDKAAGLIIPERNLSCAEHTYKGLHVLSREPLVVYVEGFLRAHEVEHIVNVRYAISLVFGPRSLVQLQLYTAYNLIPTRPPLFISHDFKKLIVEKSEALHPVNSLERWPRATRSHRPSLRKGARPALSSCPLH
jgi:hypothetical protein